MVLECVKIINSIFQDNDAIDLHEEPDTPAGN
jgi:hypothetical protein